MRRRHPFLQEPMDPWRRKCILPQARAPPYPHRGQSGERHVDWHSYCVPISRVGEYHWKCMEELLGFRAWRTVQRWRREPGDEFEVTEGVFDGAESHSAKNCMRLIKAHLDSSLGRID
jgi:hypothetical protein